MRPALVAVITLTLLLSAFSAAQADVFWPDSFHEHTYLEPSSSSHLPPSKVGDYFPGNTIDAHKNTTWSEGAPGNGLGEWLQYDITPAFTISKLGIWNGYQKSKQRFLQNGRVKAATIIYSDGTRQKIYLKDQMGVQYINCKPAQVTSIRIVIDEVYPGGKWQDTCISEIDFYLQFNPTQ